MFWPLRLAGRLYGLVPDDGAIRRMQASDFWHAPGQAAACSYLWESLRWLCRDQANMMMMFYDARSDLARVVRPPRLLPSAGGSLVLRAPVPPREDRLLYLQHM